MVYNTNGNITNNMKKMLEVDKSYSKACEHEKIVKNTEAT